MCGCTSLLYKCYKLCVAALVYYINVTNYVWLCSKDLPDSLISALSSFLHQLELVPFGFPFV